MIARYRKRTCIRKALMLRRSRTLRGHPGEGRGPLSTVVADHAEGVGIDRCPLIAHARRAPIQLIPRCQLTPL